MKLKHRVNIMVRHPDNQSRLALKGGDFTIRERLLRFLLGNKLNVLVVMPGESTYQVSVQEEVEDTLPCQI